MGLCLSGNSEINVMMMMMMMMMMIVYHNKQCLNSELPHWFNSQFPVSGWYQNSGFYCSKIWWICCWRQLELLKRELTTQNWWIILSFIHTKAVHIKICKKIIKLQKGRQEDRNILHTKLCTVIWRTLKHFLIRGAEQSSNYCTVKVTTQITILIVAAL